MVLLSQELLPLVPGQRPLSPAVAAVEVVRLDECVV